MQAYNDNKQKPEAVRNLTIATEDSLLDINEQQSEDYMIKETLLKITRNDLTEIKSIVSPNKTLQLVMSAVATLLGVQTDWPSIKRLVSQTTFLQSLMDFPHTQVSPATISKLQQYV